MAKTRRGLAGAAVEGLGCRSHCRRLVVRINSTIATHESRRPAAYAQRIFASLVSIA